MSRCVFWYFSDDNHHHGNNDDDGKSRVMIISNNKFIWCSKVKYPCVNFNNPWKFSLGDPSKSSQPYVLINSIRLKKENLCSSHYIHFSQLSPRADVIVHWDSWMEKISRIFELWKVSGQSDSLYQTTSEDEERKLTCHLAKIDPSGFHIDHCPHTHVRWTSLSFSCEWYFPVEKIKGYDTLYKTFQLFGLWSGSNYYYLNPFTRFTQLFLPFFSDGERRRIVLNFFIGKVM